MTQKRTFYEILRGQLSEDELKKAEKYITAEFASRTEFCKNVENESSILAGAFFWNNTDEGAQYWAQISHRITQFNRDRLCVAS